jgi:flavodoxin-like protein
MRAVVVYESMYGNTHLVADAVAAGLRTAYEVATVPVEQATARLVEPADLLVVGGPTHGHGMSRPTTREAAVADARKPDSPLTLDPDAEGPGLREWFARLPALHARAAAFDTRVDLPAILTGRASKGIARRLRQHGLDLRAEPESFLVTKKNTLVPGEVNRALEWGCRLAATGESGPREVDFRP